VADRATETVFGAMRSCTSRFPCPADGVTSMIQLASVVAFQVHSGGAITDTVAVPPPAAIDEPVPFAVTSHLLVDGVVELSELDVQLTAADKTARHHATITRDEARITGALE
jgi:hypothetical protein